MSLKFKKRPLLVIIILLASFAKLQAQVTLTSRASANWNVNDTWQSGNLTGTALCGAYFGNTVYGFSTLFTTELAVGADMYNTNGDYIGTVQSIASNTQLTLTASAAQYLWFESFQERKIPGATDAVVISGFNITIPSGYAAACNSLDMGITGTSSAEKLTFSASTSSLDVNADLTIYGPTGTNTREILVNAGSMNVDGNFSLGTGQTGNQSNRITRITTTTGTVTVTGNLTYNNISGSSAAQTQIVMLGGAGTFNLGGNFTVNNSSGTLTPGASSTFNFTGTNQSIPLVSSISYNNVVLSGSGYKTLTANTTIPGTLNLLAGTDLKIGSYTLTVSGTITGTGTLTGSSTSSLIITAAAGTLNFTQTSAATRSLNNLSFNSGSSATLGTPMDIYGALNLTASTFNLNAQNLTLRSNAAGTANIGNLTGSTLSGATNVTVERFVPADPTRAWRLLAVPTTGQTFKQAWQENQTAGSTTLSGYGVQLTSGSASWAANGYDLHSSSDALLTYVPAAGNGSYAGVSNTGNAMATTSGYFLYVRGDRTALPSNSTITATTLRTKGTIYQGNTTAITIPNNQYAVIGNPYPSRIDLTLLTRGSNIQDIYYVWDPLLTGSHGLGAFQTFTRSGASYTVTPGGGSYPSGPYKTIESGQAFFVHSIGTTNNTVSFTEAAKTTGSGMVFKGMAMGEQLSSNLYLLSASGKTLLDGTLNAYDDSYSNDVDELDALKMNNFDISLGLSRDNKNLVVEKRHTIGLADTIFFNLPALSQKDYQFEFVANALDHPGLTGKLIDNYLTTITPIDLNGTTTVNFSVTADATSTAAGRFMIVFYAAAPLPVTFTSIKATPQDANINVEWKVSNQLNIQKYEVERSADGTKFSKVNTQLAIGNNGSDLTYNWLDADPITGDNFYRVRSIGISGDIKYTTIVKITTSKISPAISVYPNPVVGSSFNLVMAAQPTGNYRIRLVNTSGQVVLNTTVTHAAGSSTEQVTLPAGLGSGIYMLEITRPDMSKWVQKLNYK